MNDHVNVVVDLTDEPSLSVELSRRADPPGEVVVVRPIPGVTTGTELAADLLIALGKRFDALDRERKRPQAWQLAQQWLQAERTRHVVIVDAHRLPANLWTDLAALARHVPATIWLVATAAHSGPSRRRPTAPHHPGPSRPSQRAATGPASRTGRPRCGGPRPRR